MKKQKLGLEKILNKQISDSGFLIFDFRKSILLVSVLICCLSFVSCTNDLEDIKEVEKAEAIYIETAKDVEIIYTEEGKVRAKIFAPQVRRNTKENPWTEFNAGLKLYTYNPESSEVAGQLTANYGISHEKSELMIVRDNVQVTNIDNEKIETEELFWDRKNEKVYTEKFVTITTPDEIIYGNGMDANEDFTEWTIRNIKGTVSIESDSLDAE